MRLRFPLWRGAVERGALRGDGLVQEVSESFFAISHAAWARLERDRAERMRVLEEAQRHIGADLKKKLSLGWG